MIEDRNLKPGDVIMIYRDPLTEKKPEAEANLVTLLIPASRGKACDYWDVEFVNSGLRAQRDVLVKDPAKAEAEEQAEEGNDPIDQTNRVDSGVNEQPMPVNQARREWLLPAPELAMVPMMTSVVARFMGSVKPEVKRAGKELAEEHDAFQDSLSRLGIQDALPVTAYGLNGEELPPEVLARIESWMRLVYWDGRHRLEWAAKNGVDVVPVRLVSEATGRALAEASVIGRRHWTKGQRAWLGVCQHPEVCAVKAEDSLKQNTVRTDSIGAEILTAPALAARVGVSADTVNQAVKLFRAFRAPGFAESSPEAIEAAACREKYEHLIWGGAGLGAILAGIAGGQSTEGKPKAETGFHHLDKPLAELSRLSKAFTGWDGEERAKAQRLLTARVKADMTPEFRLALAEAIAAADDLT